MNAPRAIVLAALMMSAATAEESRVLPQPRLRLDPTRSTAIAEPRETEKSKSSDGVLTMSPFIVRSARINADEREQGRLPTGPISLRGGGWIYRTESGRAHLEVGVWPYQNILWKDDRFKPELKHVGTEFVRISW